MIPEHCYHWEKTHLPSCVIENSAELTPAWEECGRCQVVKPGYTYFVLKKKLHNFIPGFFNHVNKENGHH